MCYLILVLICIPMMISDVSIFSDTCWPFVHLLQKSVCSDPFPGFKWDSFVLFFILLSLLLSCKCSLYGLGINSYRCMYICAKSVQSCPTLCDPMDHNPWGSSVHGIFQAIILEYYMPFSRESSWPRDQTHVSYVSCICRGFLYH